MNPKSKPDEGKSPNSPEIVEHGFLDEAGLEAGRKAGQRIADELIPLMLQLQRLRGREDKGESS